MQNSDVWAVTPLRRIRHACPFHPCHSFIQSSLTHASMPVNSITPCARLPACRRKKKKKGKKETYQQNQTERLRSGKSCRCRVSFLSFRHDRVKFEWLSLPLLASFVIRNQINP
jgi:hypothetical protein